MFYTLVTFSCNNCLHICHRHHKSINDVSTEQVLEARAIVPLKSRELTTQLKLSQGRSRAGFCTKKPFQHVWFPQLRIRLLRTGNNKQTRAKTTGGRETDAADELKAKHKTNLIFQISLSWNFCREVFLGCLERENWALLEEEVRDQQMWRNLQRRSKDLTQVRSKRSLW